MQPKIMSGTVTWQSPSNIALIKYWGKKEGQIPANPSLSLTLSKAVTEMRMDYGPGLTGIGQPQLDFWFDGEPNQKFREKIQNYLIALSQNYPILKEIKIEIRSKNTFPHSSGIASSASSMSALGLCLATMFTELGILQPAPDEFFREASNLARMASGSACRSVYGNYTVWGEHPAIPGSSDTFAIPFPFGIHPDFANVRDAILVISSKEKSISSRAGHGLMDSHPFAGKRYEMARSNLLILHSALTSGDWGAFNRIIEMEALVLHALMMSSNPSFFLFEPKTISVVNAVRRFRLDTGIPVCFTLDAGPNVHLLYPGEEKLKVSDWIRDELLGFCQDGFWIDDGIGEGPLKLTR